MVNSAPISTLEMLRWFYEFNDWTRPQVLDAVSQVSDDQLRQPGLIVGGVEDGSIFSTLVHIVDVEESWLARWMGTPEDPAPDPVKYATVASTAAQWEIVNQTRVDWLAGLTVDDLFRPSRAYQGANGAITTIPLWPMLFHVLHHTTHHRAEVYEALTKLGFPPPVEADVMDFARHDLGVIDPFTVVPVP